MILVKFRDLKFAPKLAAKAGEFQIHPTSRRTVPSGWTDQANNGRFVGPITALTYTSAIKDPQRFARSEDVCAHAGLVPRRSQSGERDIGGHISRRLAIPRSARRFTKRPTSHCPMSSGRSPFNGGAGKWLRPKVPGAPEPQSPKNLLHYSSPFG